MNTQVAKPQADFRDDWKKMGGEVAAALPPHIPVDRFMRVVITAVNSNPDLLNADRRSLFGAAMKAAQDGLLPDGRDGALVVFNTKEKVDNVERWIKKVQWMPMVGGILKKIRNSGELLSISAQVAYEKDKFTYVLGDDERIEHEPFMDGDRGKPRLVYAIAKTKDGGVYRDVMTVSEIEKVRNVSRAKDSGPWKDWWDEMAKKTVIRRLSKRLPMSSDLDDLIRQDDELYDFNAKGQEQRSERMFGSMAERMALGGRGAAGFNQDFVNSEIDGTVVDPGSTASDSPASESEGAGAPAAAGKESAPAAAEGAKGEKAGKKNSLRDLGETGEGLL